MAGFSDLANCLAIVALGIVTAVQWRRGLQGFEDLNYLGLLRRAPLNEIAKPGFAVHGLKDLDFSILCSRGRATIAKRCDGGTLCKAAINVNNLHSCWQHFGLAVAARGTRTRTTSSSINVKPSSRRAHARHTPRSASALRSRR